MRDQGLAAVQLEQKVFGPTLEVENALASEPLGERRGKGEANVGPAQFDLGDPGAEHRGLKAAPHSLDLRQFRHFESPNSPVREPRDFLRLL